MAGSFIATGLYPGLQPAPRCGSTAGGPQRLAALNKDPGTLGCFRKIIIQTFVTIEYMFYNLESLSVRFSYRKEICFKDVKSKFSHDRNQTTPDISYLL